MSHVHPAPGRLAGRVALVTGGASAIGRAICLRLAADGAAVVVADQREDPREGGTPTHEVIRERGGVARFVGTDVTSVADLQHAVAVADDLGGLTILVNNAGMMRAAPLVDATEEDFDALMAVNVRGAFFASQAAVRSLQARGAGGVIVNLSSMGGLQGMPGIAAYCAAKGAVRLMTYALAKELGPSGIRVCALHPGVIDTSMTRLDVRALDDSRPVDPAVALGRHGDPEDIAGAAAFLASDDAGFVTGASLTVDGGQLSIG